MSKFKIGDQVKCIDNAFTFNLVLGMTYTVKGVVGDPMMLGCLSLEGIDDYSVYEPGRFELVEPKR